MRRDRPSRRSAHRTSAPATPAAAISRPMPTTMPCAWPSNSRYPRLMIHSRQGDGRQVQAADPALPGDGGRDGAPAEQERPVHFAVAVGHLPAAPQAHEQHGQRQRRVGAQDDAGGERAQRPGQHRVGRMALDVEHLRDQHDAGAEDGDAGEDGGMGEGRMLAVEQHAGDAVGAEQAAEDHGEAEQPAASRSNAPRRSSWRRSR